MTLTNSEIKLYNDILIAEIILSDTNGLSKTAQEGVASQLISKVHSYVSNNINPEDKTGSLLNMLAPGAITVLFRALGLGWLGFLFGIAMRVFHIDVASIIESIWNSLKSELSGGKQMTSAQVDNIVNSAVETHTKPATQEEAEKASQTYQLQSVNFRDAKMLKLALADYALLECGIIKQSGILDIFSSQKTKTASILSRVLSLFFKVALASAAAMVAGDVINKFLGRPNALDDTMQHGKPVGEQATAPAVISKQTKFKVSPSYHDTPKGGNWIENVSNTKEGIQDMLTRFTKEVYPDTGSMDGVIRSTAGFQAIVDNILWHNHTSAGGPIVFIPPMFSSKKMLVDHFIDDVAEKAP
jgi:hypothetical protein